MKLFLNFLLVCLLTVANCYGRQQGRPLQRIHAAKMVYITDKLALTEEQAGKFNPVYREYEKELLAIRQPYLKKYKLSGADDDDFTARQYVEDDLDYQQQVIELKRSYNERFLKVLTARQIADMYIAEREFRHMLVRRLQQRRGGRSAVPGEGRR